MRLRWSSVVVAIGLLALGAMVFAHGGGVDGQGGHNNKKAGNYHFHSGPLTGQTFASKAAATAALARANEKPGAATSPTSTSTVGSAGANGDERLDALIRVLVQKGIVSENELQDEVRALK